MIGYSLALCLESKRRSNGR